MRSPAVDIYYFSGTGNTLLTADKVKEVLENNALAVTLFPIERADPAAVNPEHALGLAFPVANFSTYPFVWDFIRRLPKTKGTEAFAFDTLGGRSGGIIGHLRRVLAQKGYTPVGAAEIVMPANIFFIENDTRNRECRERGLRAAGRFARTLVDGTARWGRIPFFSDCVDLCSRAVMATWKIPFGQKLFAFRLDRNKCTRCGICQRLCPVGNISLEDGYPAYHGRCQYCLRCASLCPAGALGVPFNKGGKTYTAVTAGRLVD